MGTRRLEGWGGEEGERPASHCRHRTAGGDVGAGALGGQGWAQASGPGRPSVPDRTKHTTHFCPMHFLPGCPVGLSLRAFKCFHTHTKGKEWKFKKTGIRKGKWKTVRKIGETMEQKISGRVHPALQGWEHRAGAEVPAPQLRVPENAGWDRCGRQAALSPGDGSLQRKVAGSDGLRPARRC